MKLLLFSDLHTDLAASRAIAARSRDYDLLIGAGDFCMAHRGLERTVDVLRAIDRPTVLVPGNSETTEELEQACSGWGSAVVLHGAGAEVAGVPVFGIGGGIPVTPFGSWSYDFTEEQAIELLAECGREVVLVSHSPPRGAVDVASNGRSLGSESIRSAILELRPRLVVCGHIHDSSGRCEEIDGVPVVNAGPGGFEWELD